VSRIGAREGFVRRAPADRERGGVPGLPTRRVSVGNILCKETLAGIDPDKTTLGEFEERQSNSVHGALLSRCSDGRLVKLVVYRNDEQILKTARDCFSSGR
jgi:hypothetical protein